MTATEIEVRLLGAFQLLVAGRPVTVSSDRQRVLIAALALEAGQVVSIDRLADSLWGEDLPERVRGSLQTYVMRARRHLGQDAIDTAPHGYRLAIDPDQVDALRFLRLVEAPDGDSDNDGDGDGDGATAPAELRSRLDAALELWRGDPLSGVESTTLYDEHGPRLVERHLQAVEHSVDLDLAALPPAPRPHQAARLQELLVTHALREPLWERLIRVLRATGRTAEALAAYATCSRHLADELGVAPGKPLQQLHLELLAEDEPPTEPQAEPPADPGSDAELPGYAGTARDSPDSGVRPQQLPADIGHFTGRGRQLATLDGFLVDHHGSRSTVVVIEGPAGAGKTSLAVHWAHQIRTEFPDGQLYVDLRGHAEAAPLAPDVVLDSMLRAIGVPADAIPQTTAERSAMLRSRLADQRVVLLLDNARDAGQVRPLLPGPGSLTLITSRSQLPGLVVREGARRIGLGGFGEPEARSLLAGGIGGRRVAAEPEATGELIELCGRLPLALALAAERAARFPDLPLARLVAELGDRGRRLDTLGASGDLYADLRATFSWSYHAMTAPAARLFRLLGLHAGVDVDADAAAALLGEAPGDTRALLADLVSAHLLEEPHPGRYRFHDLLGVYAAERAADGETAEERHAAIRRITDHYLHTVARTRAFVAPSPRVREIVGFDPAENNPFTDAADALAWLERERANLLATIRRLATDGWDEDVWRLGSMLFALFRTRRDTTDWVPIAELAVAAAERVGRLDARFHATINLAAAYNTPVSAELSVARNEEVLEIARQLDDVDKISLALMNLGSSYTTQGDFHRAAECSEEAMELARTFCGVSDQALVASNLTDDYIKLGRYDDAVRAGSEAVELFGQLDNEYYGALAHANLAAAHLGLGELNDALRYAARARSGFQVTGALAEGADNLYVLGRVHALRGETEQARVAWEEALAIRRDLGDERVSEVERVLADLGPPDAVAPTATDTPGDNAGDGERARGNAPHPSSSVAHPRVPSPPAGP